jgi:ABC-type uncharacterized transport system YnjBCD substrate-binding protein
MKEKMKREKLLQEEQRELAPDLEASWIALQRKTEMYDKMTSGELEEGQDGNTLIVTIG